MLRTPADIRIPPLRERGEDIVDFAYYWLKNTTFHPIPCRVYGDGFTPIFVKIGCTIKILRRFNPTPKRIIFVLLAVYSFVLPKPKSS